MHEKDAVVQQLAGQKPAGNKILEVRNLSKDFGGLRAVDSMDFEVFEGEILGIIGPNGSGKSTIVNMISGFYSPTGGQIIFEGRDITRADSVQIAKMGIGRTFQLLSLFDGMTFLQNVLVSVQLQERSPAWRFLFRALEASDKAVKESAEILNFLKISDYMNQSPGNAPSGVQRRLELAIAMARGSKLLLLDEPLSGMTLAEAHEMIEILKSLKQKGITVLIIEHNVRAMVSLCDRIVAINYGKKITEGSPKDVIQNETVIKSYLGDMRLG